MNEIEDIVISQVEQDAVADSDSSVVPAPNEAEFYPRTALDDDRRDSWKRLPSPVELNSLSAIYFDLADAWDQGNSNGEDSDSRNTVKINMGSDDSVIILDIFNVLPVVAVAQSDSCAFPASTEA